MICWPITFHARSCKPSRPCWKFSVEIMHCYAFPLRFVNNVEFYQTLVDKWLIKYKIATAFKNLMVLVFLKIERVKRTYLPVNANKIHFNIPSITSLNWNQESSTHNSLFNMHIWLQHSGGPYCSWYMFNDIHILFQEKNYSENRQLYLP